MPAHNTLACNTSGLATLIKDHLAGGASRLTALRLPQILPVFSVDAPCHPGAALRDLVLVQRGQTTRLTRSPRTFELVMSAADEERRGVVDVIHDRCDGIMLALVHVSRLDDVEADMKKCAGVFIALMVCAVPAFAQRAGGGHASGSGGHAGEGGGHMGGGGDTPSHGPGPSNGGGF